MSTHEWRSVLSHQRCVVRSPAVNVNAPVARQDGSLSLPAPVVNRMGFPFTLPVRAEIPSCQRLVALPMALEKITLLVDADQQPGTGTAGLMLTRGSNPASTS